MALLCVLSLDGGGPTESEWVSLQVIPNIAPFSVVSSAFVLTGVGSEFYRVATAQIWMSQC